MKPQIKTEAKISKTDVVCVLLATLSTILLVTALIPPKAQESEPTLYILHTPLVPAVIRVKELARLTEDENGIDNTWALWLINAYNPLPYGYIPQLSTIGKSDLDGRVAEYAILMIMAARNDGLILSPVSAYRSVERQAENFENSFNNERYLGRSAEDAFYYTIARIAAPYTSEHNAGLAIDFNIAEETFDATAEFRWLRDNAHKFGFIMRYPEATSDITGIIYEPWHYRFVGLYHAERIYNWGITLEEYIGYSAEDDSVFNEFKEQYIA
ncbi:MAG: M15 family metallopeptidase [Oscillospiraceae bacterium]|nr:M15 family metallopeptidase [Oscillospiraceae bacterium]